MKMFNWMGKKKIVDRQQNYVIHVKSLVDSMLNQMGMPSGNNNSADAYKFNAIVHSCIKLLAGIISNYDVLMFDAKGEIVESHPALDTITKRANSIQSGDAFIRTMITNFLRNGNGYALKQTFNQKIELIPLKPERVTPVPTFKTNPMILKYKLDTGSGNPTPYKIDEIFHIKTENPDSLIVGLSPLEVGALCITSNSLLDTNNKELLENKNMLEAVMTSTIPLGPAQKSDLEVQMAKAKSEKGSTLFIDGSGGMDYHQLATNPKDMEYQAMYNRIVRQLTSIYGVPSELIGDAEHKTYNNAEEARISVNLNTALPIADMFYQELSYFLFPNYDYNFIVNRDNIPAIASVRSRAIESLETASFLEINEKRAALKLKPVKGGDVVLVDNSKQNLEDVGSQSL